MRKIIIKIISLILLCILFSANSVFAFDWSKFNNEYYDMVEDDMDDSIRVYYWNQKDTAFNFTLLDNNNNIDSISLSGIIGTDEHKTSL